MGQQEREYTPLVRVLLTDGGVGTSEEEEESVRGGEGSLAGAGLSTLASIHLCFL